MKKVYLDGASNTPMSLSVLMSMLPYMLPTFKGNSMSIHDFGIKAGIAVERARKSILTDLGFDLDSANLTFTSGATEGNNWVITSILFDYLKNPIAEKPHVICSVTEHASVLNSCKRLEECGIEVTYVPLHSSYALRLKDIKPLIKKNTKLICCMAVNNETGVNNHVEEIAKYANKMGISVLMDCTQALSYGGIHNLIGKHFPSVSHFSFSGHKIYGPSGIGALISRQNPPTNALIVGGAQESGLRGGTVNVPGAVGLAKAVKMMRYGDIRKHYEYLFIFLHNYAKKFFPKMTTNGSTNNFNIISLNFSEYFNVDNLAAILANYSIAVSAGSACDSEHDETKGEFNGSHVLQSMGLSEKAIRNSIRVSFTRQTKISDIKRLINALRQIQKDFQLEE